MPATLHPPSRSRTAHLALLVDDQPDFYGFAQLFFRRCGWNLAWTTDPEEGPALAAILKPDWVLADWVFKRSPEPGARLVRRLKRDPLTRSVPVALVSAVRSDPSYAAEARELGADIFLAKEAFEPSEGGEQLLEELRRRVPSSRPRPVPRVLVVEDDDECALTLRMWLEHAGCEVAVSSRGGDVVRRARAEEAALVILDLALPGKNGAELLGELTADPRFRARVVIHTAQPDASGALGYLLKDKGAEEVVRKPSRRLVFLDAAFKALDKGPRQPPKLAPWAVERQGRFAAGSLRVDLLSGEVWFDGLELEGIGWRGLRLLAYLTLFPQGVTKDRILAEVWCEEASNPKAVDMVVLRLRDLLGPARDLLETCDHGYRLAPPPPPQR